MAGADVKARPVDEALHSAIQGPVREGESEWRVRGSCRSWSSSGASARTAAKEAGEAVSAAAAA